MNDVPEVSEDLKRLPKLAEFRFQLRRFLSFSEVESEKLGVATQQYQLMQVIGALPEGESASITYLAERMALRHNSTVELVDRAERAGLVQRRTDVRDLRRSIVALTGQGQAMLLKLIAAHLAELDGMTGAQLLRSLSELRDERPLETQSEERPDRDVQGTSDSKNAQISSTPSSLLISS